jgi:hypothetical protein
VSGPTRTQVGRALHALVAGARWGDPQTGFAYTSQRLHLWDDVPAQPAMMTQEGDERWSQTTRGLPLRIWEYRLIIYHSAGRDTTVERPADESGAILDALEALFLSADPDRLQTLGGLVHSVKITGTILKDDGALDGQAMIVVPIDVTVP